MSVSRKRVVISTAPSLLMLGLFYSLAAHMYKGLGQWPTGFGRPGWPASLVAHEYMTTYWFTALIWFGIFVWPLLMLLSLLVPRWRQAVPYLAIYGLTFLACWGLMQLAPEGFLYWGGD